MAFFAYGYFVKTPTGISHAGHDFAPTLHAYKVGDSLGIKNGAEGIVIGILKGEPAKKSGGYDVFVLLEARPPRAPGAPIAAEQDFFQTGEGQLLLQMLTREPGRLVSRPQIQATVGDNKFRAVGKKLYRRPLKESFYDFQLNHLLWLLGEDWFNAEMAKPLEDRHVILKWRDERNQQLRKHQDPNDPEALVRAPVTGGMRALHVLADDLYQLAHALEPPRQILARLGDLRLFQEARYEILAASLFARCGFEIDFIEDTSKRNPEFIAEKDRERIAVEAKSRHRAGVLNQRGEFREDAPAEIRRLYESAAGQNPGDLPFLIFIDVNLPLTPEVDPLQKDWIVEAMRMFEHRHLEGLQNYDTALILTNFGWHFEREEGTPAGENMWARAENPRFPVRAETLELLGRAISEYGKVVDEEERRR
jgi:hypothetical protein